MVNHVVAVGVSAPSYRGRKTKLIFGMGIPELTIILIVALLIFGPKSLPKIGTAVGKTVKNVRKGFEEELNDSDEKAEGDPVDVVSISDEKPCPSCGFPNPAQSTYCSKCGAKL